MAIPVRYRTARGRQLDESVSDRRRRVYRRQSIYRRQNVYSSR